MFGKGAQQRSSATRELRERVRTLLDGEEDDVIVVTELQCMDMDCPDVETVFALLRGGREPVHVKVPKAVTLIREPDLQDVIVRLKDGLS